MTVVISLALLTTREMMLGLLVLTMCIIRMTFQQAVYPVSSVIKFSSCDTFICGWCLGLIIEHCQSLGHVLVFCLPVRKTTAGCPVILMFLLFLCLLSSPSLPSFSSNVLVIPSLLCFYAANLATNIKTPEISELRKICREYKT